VNTFYTLDFPSAIKTDQLQDTLEVFTEPNVDRYRVNINDRINLKNPVYVEGREAIFFKTLVEFYDLFPRQPVRNIPATGDGTTTIFNFNLPGPFLSHEVTIGSVNNVGSTIRVTDDGRNVLEFVTFEPLTGDSILTPIGSINYVTGATSVTFPIAPGAGEEINVWTSTYSSGFPYCLLFYKDEIRVRPVPDGVYKLDIQTFKSPTPFLSESDMPQLKQWWQYIAYGAAIEILRDREDTEGIMDLMEGFKRQELLVLERQASAEIGIRTPTILNSPGFLPYGRGTFDSWGGW